MMLYVYMLGTVLFTLYGQMILKWRIGQYGELPLGFLAKVLFLLKLTIDPYIFSGLVAAFVSALFWMAAMTKADISYVYPYITGGLTLLSVLLAVILLGEQLTWVKGVGAVLIVLGVIFMSYSNPA